MKEVIVSAPASSANLGPGFDVFALALKAPRDRIRLSVKTSSRFKVEVIAKGKSPIPPEPARSPASAVALEMARDFGIRAHATLTVERNIPIGVGMGSSAASAVATAVAMDESFNLDLPVEDLVYYSSKGELASSGAAHYDNVSASLAGGFVIARAGKKLPPIRFHAPKSLAICIAIPQINLPRKKTAFARSILPKRVTLRRAVSNLSNASAMVSGFARGDVDLIGKSMNDQIVEPVRGRLIPGYREVRLKGVRAGASGACISGAGPSMLAVVDKSRCSPDKVLDKMLLTFEKFGVKASGFVTMVGEGARVVKGG